MNAFALAALALVSQAAPAPVAASREVIRSTAPLSAQPADIPALKRRILADQDQVQKTRSAVKKAQKGKDASALAKARESWTLAKDRLKADRGLLRQAIEAHEAEHREHAKLKP